MKCSLNFVVKKWRKNIGVGKVTFKSEWKKNCIKLITERANLIVYSIVSLCCSFNPLMIVRVGLKDKSVYQCVSSSNQDKIYRWIGYRNASHYSPLRKVVWFILDEHAFPKLHKGSAWNDGRKRREEKRIETRAHIGGKLKWNFLGIFFCLRMLV